MTVTMAVPEVRELLVGASLSARVGDFVLDIPRIGLREGELLAVLGPNGCGKSTLLRVLAGLQRPDSGEVRLDGEPVEAENRARIAMVFQRPFLWSGSVRWNLGVGLRFAGVGEPELSDRVRRAAAGMGIEAILDADARSISGGEAQRVAIARALALEPAVLFLDEPTSNLDAGARAALRRDLERVTRDEARAAILSMHDLAEAFYLADRVAVLRAGTLAQIGTPSALYEDPQDDFIAAVTGAEFGLAGTVLSREDRLLRVDIGAAELTVIGGAEPGDRVKVAYRPEDIFLSADPISRASPRNVLELQIVEVRPAGGLLRVHLGGAAELVAIITRAAGEELEIEPGRIVYAHAKATALRAFPLG